ncbi:D-glycerate 3-kinase [Fontimonas thermophila]|uniref:D-glycerate 3-kinase n=1 Tax=Fontimonas thermophila TaxID=1076937 RepID=A0A1I2IHS9_9GAMM|nr:kinase [Fontimonas thermophila]SFF40627.1 D-glycerate 3-kinase [Fontimonas thermophila]
MTEERPDCAITAFCRARGLPAHYADAARTHLRKLAQWISVRHRQTGHRLVIGVNGAQGSGKTTLCALLELLLRQNGLRSAVLSIDDLYLPRAQRLALAHTVHPLLATRGVPGTHDVDLGQRLLDGLRRGIAVTLPRFDKLSDDRLPTQDWIPIDEAVDIILFEGWCVGTPAQTDSQLDSPINALEAEEDTDGRWRRWVNTRLREDYPRLFAAIDHLVFLRIPGFEQVFEWRWQQEAELAAAGHRPGMDADTLRRFIQHYERLTRHALAVLPDRADICIELARDHSIAAVHYRQPGP